MSKARILLPRPTDLWLETRVLFSNSWPLHEEAMLLPSWFDFIVSLHGSRIFACGLPTKGAQAPRANQLHSAEPEHLEEASLVMFLSLQ